MSVDINVRSASDGDTSACASIDDGARQVLAGQRGGEAWLVEHDPLGDLHEWWSQSFVADIDGVIVGFLIGRIDRDRRGKVFRVDRVYVVEGARELGCGDDLLAMAIERATAEGCALLEAIALPGDRDTKNLYERAGITARSITVSKRLSDPSSSADASR